jgi:bzd-type benzoyl-CoA reductase N subunit
MDAMQPFHDIAADPKAYARSWKARTGGKVIGTLCSYAPEELILAAGALGFRIVGSSGAISKADAHLQAYSCSLVRSALEEALSDRLDFLDGTIFPHTCDSIQRLSDLWRMNSDTGFHLDVVLPVKLNTESAREYMTAVLHKAKRELENLLGTTITEKDLRAAVDTCNRIRQAMQTFYTHRRDCPGAISGRDVHAITRAAMVMDRQDFLATLNAVMAQLPPPADTVCGQPKRILLSGGVCNLPDIYDPIEKAGGAVVWDDLCTGSRQMLGIIDIRDDLIAAIGDRYRERAVCPAKHAGVRLRGKELVRTAQAVDAQGVIFLYLKFCDPHAFDYPYLKETLAVEGIPTLMVELEEQTASDGQFQTRCEAFMEML